MKCPNPKCRREIPEKYGYPFCSYCGCKLPNIENKQADKKKNILSERVDEYGVKTWSRKTKIIVIITILALLGFMVYMNKQAKGMFDFNRYELPEYELGEMFQVKNIYFKFNERLFDIDTQGGLNKKIYEYRGEIQNMENLHLNTRCIDAIFYCKDEKGNIRKVEDVHVTCSPMEVQSGSTASISVEGQIEEKYTIEEMILMIRREYLGDWEATDEIVDPNQGEIYYKIRIK